MQGSLLIKGKFSGVIRCASHVSIDKSAWVESCTLAATTASVAGRFSGSIEVNGLAEFLDRSRVSASVKCQSLRISPSCSFDGHVAMPDIDLQDLRLNKPIQTAGRSSGD